jgi:lipoprotein-anchoring transpeptidase ErfK/SrfK
MLPPSWTASLAALAIVGAAAALSGCGGGDEPAAVPAPPPASSSTAAAAPEPVPAAPATESEAGAPQRDAPEPVAPESTPGDPVLVEPEAGVPAEQALPAGAEPERAGAPAASARRATAPEPQLTVHLRRPADLRSRPGGPVVARLSPRTEFDSPQVLPVVRQSGRWLGVMSSVLPNRRIGWIRAAASMQAHRTAYRIDASLRRREVVVRRDGRVVSRFPVAIGGAGTPTPTGRYAVTDKLLTGNAASPYGCCILALSGHQTQTPQGWGGGDRLAIHATNLPETIGTAASLGCLRAPAEAARRLVQTVPLGTIVTIRA